MKPDCIGFGICAADYLCIVPNYPRLNEKTEAIESSYQGGGPVATAMVTLSQLGFNTSFIGKVGKDRDGSFVLDQFKQDRVDTSGIIVDEKMPTNKAFIWIDQKSGKRSIVLNGNTYLPVKPDEINLNKIAPAKYLLIDGRDTESTYKLIRWARKNGSEIVLDAGSPRNDMEKLLRLVDYPVVSQSFCQKYFSTDDYRTAIKKMLELGAKAAVVTVGSKGCFGGDQTGCFYQPAFDVNVTDTTGAGDVFHGAFIAGLLMKKSLPENMRFSSGVAALKCTRLGGRAGIKNLKEVLTFLESK